MIGGINIFLPSSLV
jgi:hypothetical protein